MVRRYDGNKKPFPRRTGDRAPVPLVKVQFIRKSRMWHATLNFILSPYVRNSGLFSVQKAENNKGNTSDTGYIV
jgi:hypothetical protein